MVGVNSPSRWMSAFFPPHAHVGWRFRTLERQAPHSVPRGRCGIGVLKAVQRVSSIFQYVQLFRAAPAAGRTAAAWIRALRCVSGEPCSRQRAARPIPDELRRQLVTPLEQHGFYVFNTGRVQQPAISCFRYDPMEESSTPTIDGFRFPQSGGWFTDLAICDNGSLRGFHLNSEWGESVTTVIAQQAKTPVHA